MATSNSTPTTGNEPRRSVSVKVGYVRSRSSGTAISVEDQRRQSGGGKLVEQQMKQRGAVGDMPSGVSPG